MTALIIFILALIFIIIFFTIKHFEVQKNANLFKRDERVKLDDRIVSFEQLCNDKCTLQHAQFIVGHGYNTLAHKFAKVTASIAKRVEWRARSVAHKSAKAKLGGEQVRENGYLKEVQEHKDSLDIVEVAEQSKL